MLNSVEEFGVLILLDKQFKTTTKLPPVGF